MTRAASTCSSISGRPGVALAWQGSGKLKVFARSMRNGLAWSSWCANLDEDVRHAKEFLRDRKLRWEHALLGEWSSTDVPKRFAVSSVPTYVLVGPDGRIVAHDGSLDAIASILDQATSRSTSR